MYSAIYVSFDTLAREKILDDKISYDVVHQPSVCEGISTSTAVLFCTKDQQHDSDISLLSAWPRCWISCRVVGVLILSSRDFTVTMFQIYRNHFFMIFPWNKN